MKFKMLSIFAAWAVLGLAYLTLSACAVTPAPAMDPIKMEITVMSEMATVAVDQYADVTYNDENLNSERGNELSAMSYVSGGRLNMYLYSGMNVGDVVRMHKDMRKVEDNTDIRIARLFINSPGGSAFSGLAMADLITQARDRGWTVEAEASGIVASAAVPVFAVCSPRYASAGTLFMVHEAALWKWPGKETASDIRAQQELMVNLQARYLAYLVDNSNLSLTTWIEKERNTTWFTAEQAMAWDMVDGIR